MTAPDQRFAGLLFDLGKPEAPKPQYPKLDGVVKERPIPNDLVRRESFNAQEYKWDKAEDDLPPVPELGDVRTIQLVRKAIHVMRGGTARDVTKEEMDGALAVFDRALAALLRRLQVDEEASRRASYGGD